MGYSFSNVLAPLWRLFPEIEPTEMKEPYVKPEPTLSAESEAALRDFLLHIKETITFVKAAIPEDEARQLFTWGGVQEVEQAVSAIEQFLEHPRFKDDN